jgi:hypothetical protein
METIYLICALSGGALLLCQLLLSLIGLGGHHDVGGHDFHDLGGHDGDVSGHDGDATGHHDAAHDSSHEGVAAWFVSMLTFRTLVSALTFFGLAGMAGNELWGETPTTFLVALAAGAGALFMVGSLMRSLYRLRAEGTVRMDRAVGKNGTVYLPIPGQKGGLGKVMLNLQNRTVECQALTSEQGLPTGAPIVVVAVLGPDTVEVAAAHSSGG